MKFIHTADWQIGMTFHGFKEKSRIMMEDDRLEVIEAIGEYAKNPKNEIDFVLKKLGLSQIEFEELMKKPRIEHNEFGHKTSLLKRYPILKLLRPIKKLIVRS